MARAKPLVIYREYGEIIAHVSCGTVSTIYAPKSLSQQALK